MTEELHKFNNIAWFFWCVSAFSILAVCVSIYRQPESSAPLDFKVKHILVFVIERFVGSSDSLCTSSQYLGQCLSDGFS